MYRLFVLLPPLLPILLLLAQAAAQIEEGLFDRPTTGCYQPGLAEVLKQGCHTASDFCSDLLSSSASSTLILTKFTTSYYSPHVTSTIKATKTRTIIRTTATDITTLFTSIGRITKTVNQCNPTATCGAYKGAPRGHLREACSCVLGVPTTTTTEQFIDIVHTSTSLLGTETVVEKVKAQTTKVIIETKHVPTVTVYDCNTVAPPVQTCRNKGHQYAQYTLTSKDVAQPPSSWNLDTYKSLVPEVNGTARLLGAFFRSPFYYIYENYYRFGTKRPKNYPNDVSFGSPCEEEYLNDRGYIYAPQTGSYKFSIPSYGQAAFIWVGKTAVSSYNVTNALVSAEDSGDFQGGGPIKSKFLVAGRYYPLRVAWRCTAQNSDFYLQIIQPDGHIMHGEYFRVNFDETYSYFNNFRTVEIYTPYIVQFGCGKDRAAAPVFPDWGDEA